MFPEGNEEDGWDGSQERVVHGTGIGPPTSLTCADFTAGFIDRSTPEDIPYRPGSVRRDPSFLHSEEAREPGVWDDLMFMAQKDTR